MKTISKEVILVKPLTKSMKNCSSDVLQEHQANLVRNLRLWWHLHGSRSPRYQCLAKSLDLADTEVAADFERFHIFSVYILDEKEDLELTYLETLDDFDGEDLSDQQARNTLPLHQLLHLLYLQVKLARWHHAKQQEASISNIEFILPLYNIAEKSMLIACKWLASSDERAFCDEYSRFCTASKADSHYLDLIRDFRVDYVLKGETDSVQIRNLR